MVVGGQVFKEGTIISTPVFALHMMKEVWGEDAELFNPERWEKEDKTEMYRAFAPFSIGPRYAFLVSSFCLLSKAYSCARQGMFRKESRDDGDTDVHWDDLPPV